MRCHPPKGRPAPSISWLQNDRPIDPTSDKNFIVTGEGHLIVVAARLSDTNNYTCVAENVASKRFSDPATITVYGKRISVLEGYFGRLTPHPKKTNQGSYSTSKNEKKIKPIF